MEYILIYIFLLIITCFISTFIQKKSTIKDYFLIIILALIWSVYGAIWKYDVPGDRMNYVTWFKYVYPLYQNNFSMILQQNNEIGWFFYNVILTKMITNINFLFYLYSFFPIVATLLYLYKQTGSYKVLHLFFSISPIVLYTTYLCRQMNAYAFIILSIYFFKRKKYIFTVLFGFTSFLFHKTSLVCMIIYILYILVNKSIINKKTNIYFSIFLLFLLPIIPNIITVFFSVFHLDKWIIVNQISLSIFKGIPYLIIYIIFLNYKGNLKDINTKNNSFNAILCFFVFYFWLLSIFNTWIYRISIFFLFGYITISSFLLINEKRQIPKLVFLSSQFTLFILLLREIYLVSTYL